MKNRRAKAQEHNLKIGDPFYFRGRADVHHTVREIRQTNIGPYVMACCNNGYPADQVVRSKVGDPSKTGHKRHCGDANNITKTGEMP